MERGFDITSGSLAIGDPTMGLVQFDLQLPPGRYRCERGSLRSPGSKDTQTIRLDGPYLFVVDASCCDQFLEWYHRTFDECGYDITRVAMRLDEAAEALGTAPGFYWEESLSGEAREGTYALEKSLIVKSS